MQERCILIPAIKKNAVIPDQLVKKLAGITLMERALNTARACVPAHDILTFTDSEEICLICERAHTRAIYNKAFKFKSLDIVEEMKELLEKLRPEYKHCIILRASCPLLTWIDVEKAWKKYRESGADALITVRAARQRMWAPGADNTIQALLADMGGADSGQKDILLETRALIILNLALLNGARKASGKTLPYFLGEKSHEIQSYQDWWICERLLERRHVVFVVAGFPAIGMGHVYRALMLAHEISSHKITFVCTRESEMAVESVANRDYPVIRQGAEPLVQTVLAQNPDLVINDILNTSAEYMQGLAASGTRCVNFEDEGTGADLANLVINALYEKKYDSDRTRCGPDYFCLRDEFVNAPRNAFRQQVKTLLITFGGTDPNNSAMRCLNIVAPICRAYAIAIRIVAGPGYAHKDELEAALTELANPQFSFAWATNIMSRMMENVDLAICSAGRTVYELAHMRIPALVLATHDREASHNFARARNGFAFVGVAEKITDNRIRNMFLAMLDPKRRARFWERQNKFNFAGNKARVVGLLENQLEQSENL